MSVGALLLATAGELLLPAILRRATDEHILPYYRAVRWEALDDRARAALRPAADPAPTVGELHFLPAGKLSALSGREQRGRKGHMAARTFGLERGRRIHGCGQLVRVGGQRKQCNK